MLEPRPCRWNTGRLPLDQCLFGEHLLNKYPDAHVAIVEAEKTALVARLFMPEVLWIATGGLTELKLSKLLPLADRHVTLWPDLRKGFREWSAKAAELDPLFASLQVADLLEGIATEKERAAGLDLADYLLSRGDDPNGSEPRTPPLLPMAVKVQAFIQQHRLENAVKLLDLDLSQATVKALDPTAGE